MSTGGVRAFLRRGKFVPTHSELESFLTGQTTRAQGMSHLRDMVRPNVHNARQLRKQTLEDLKAWDVVYLDRMAAGRAVPGDPTSAAEPLRGLQPNEALLVQHAKSRALVSKLPPIVQKKLHSLLKKIADAWKQDEKEYDRLYPAHPKPLQRRDRKGARPAPARKAAKKKRAAARPARKPARRKAKSKGRRR